MAALSSVIVVGLVALTAYGISVLQDRENAKRAQEKQDSE